MHPTVKSQSNHINLDQVTCEKYRVNLLKSEMKEKSKPFSQIQKHCNSTSKKPSYNIRQLNRTKADVQHNYPLQSRKSCGNLDEFLEVASSYPSVSSADRHRSKSAAEDREPWGQLLKSGRNTDRSSIFGSFDPLRTLHFLVKELQFQLKRVLPDDNTILQTVLDMNQALKRVPPEVASAIHLQQTLGLLPNRKDSKPVLDFPEKLKLFENGTQISAETEETEKIQTIMLKSSLKLEASCKQMETLCIDLKTDKEELEKQLKNERENILFYKKRIDDLENINNLLTSKIKTLETDKLHLTSELQNLKNSLENQYLSSVNSLQSQISELANSKLLMEQESTKIRHQLKLRTLEKEKCLSILTVRDQQISHMNDEMLQLHEIISDRFLDSAIKSLPGVEFLLKDQNYIDYNKENIGDSLSTILSNQHVEKPFTVKQNMNFRELLTENLDNSDIYPSKQVKKPK